MAQTPSSRATTRDLAAQLDGLDTEEARASTSGRPISLPRRDPHACSRRDDPNFRADLLVRRMGVWVGSAAGVGISQNSCPMRMIFQPLDRACRDFVVQPEVMRAAQQYPLVQVGQSALRLPQPKVVSF
ncbi:hypothetical protein JF66_00325 [Cryobacterium sp. MLB-32]|nr:hypothetical protein JF66_00325 [Cryobacterium sp. MLB-32]